MTSSTPDFELAVQAVEGSCPVGETYALANIAAKKTPVLACEGPCIRGEIARLAADIIAKEAPEHARACHGEAFFVPRSAMARWVREADHVLMIDGCFLKCHGRVLNNLVGADNVLHIDANRIHHKFANVFLTEEVPKDELEATARSVADRVLERLAGPDRMG